MSKVWRRFKVTNWKRSFEFFLTLVVFGATAFSVRAYPLLTLTTNVSTLSGTANSGNTFPGAVVPFGMVQWSPDTTPSEPGGYLYTASRIVGFGLDHMSGAGDPYGGDFDFTPILGNVATSPAASGSGKNYFPSVFSHTNETAVPGYYAVQFTNGILTELTTTPRTGFGRFTYPAGSPASMVINASSGAPGTTAGSIQINPSGQEVSGWTSQVGFDSSSQPVIVYFDAVFDHPFASYGVWDGATLATGGTNAADVDVGAYFTFSLPNGGTILARAALSYVSVANAQSNLLAESPVANFTSAGFNAMTAAASNNWNGYLNKIQVSGGSAVDTATFYTMLYHALQAPSVVSDVNGQYMGFDGEVHTAAGFTKYEYFSGWDVYRNECQLVAMMDPARASDMAQSLVQDAHDIGAMPRWSVADGDTGVMIGDPATPIIAGMYAFGATNFNTATALAAMAQAATNPATEADNGIYERNAERDYLNQGYVPEAQSGGRASVSMTLEYCSADAAMARFARAVGDITNYTLAMNRTQNWRNLYNAGSGYLQMRRSDSLWSPGFVITGSSYDNNQATDEGSASQYTWMVPFNLGGLIDAMGGTAAASARLDTFFTLLNDGSSSEYAYLGNEPCSQTPWIYNYLGEPYKASSVVRQIMTQLYSTAPGGLPGNDDLGQMSSWYVLAALGIHPEIPGDDVLTFNGPLFPQALIHLNTGDIIITANGAGDDAPYVQTFSLNGVQTNVSWLRFADIAHGASLALTMGAVPNTNWGADLSLAPPSYTDGMNTPLAQTYYWGTGLESSDIQPTWTSTVDPAAYPIGGSANISPIKSTATGPELAVRSENSQSGSDEIMFSGRAQGAANEYANMEAFDLTSQNVVITPGMHFAYWIFPQSQTNYSSVSGNNSLFVALNLIFTDGTTLWSSGLTDQHGVPVNPTNEPAVLQLDTWNYVTVDLTPLAGKTIQRIDLGYSQPNGSGGYRGYVDDIALTTPASANTNNLALNQPATTDSQQSATPASNGNDGNVATAWSASDANPGHWWQVDLGSLCALTGDEIIWPTNGQVYNYTVTVSSDNINWTTVVNKTANPSIAQDQSDVFIASARYVRVTLTGIPVGSVAGFNEFRVWGTPITLPSVPANVQAKGGYGMVSLNWQSSAGATNYVIARAIASGAETIIANVSGTNYADLGLVNGTTYYYRVLSANLAGESANSTEVSATPQAPPPGSYDAAVMTQNPIAYWPLNETNGSTAYDVVGGHSGTYLGGVTLNQATASLPGFTGQTGAPLFDGISGYVDIPGNIFNLTNAVTVMAWVNAPTVSHFSGVIGRGNASWRLSVSASGDPGACDGDDGDATSPTSITGSGWHQLVYVYSGEPNETDNGSLYVDGVLAANDTVPNLAGSSYDVWIGGSPDYGTSRLFAGNLARAAVFTNALSASEILSLYHASQVTPPAFLKIGKNLGGNVILNWNQGALLQSTNLVGPWTTNVVKPPYTVLPTNSQMFFKVNSN